MMLLWALAALAGDPEAGRAVYEARCQVCHGPEGRGDGPAARGLSVAPADLTTEAFWEERDEADLRQVITKGTPSGTMRGNRLKPERLDDLVAYLLTLKP